VKERAELIARLERALRSTPGVRAIALGGSDATGRTDALSDIDLSVVAGAEHVEAVFDAVAAALQARAPLRAHLRLPEPTWHGFSQAFYSLEGLPESTMVDLCVIPASLPREARFLEVERHGHYATLFDPEGLFTPVAMDWDAHLERARTGLETLRLRAVLFGHLPEKAVVRGHLAEAMSFYSAMVLKPLVDVLRARFCVERFDYGPRYLDRDLPEAEQAFVEALLFPVDADQLIVFARRARERLAAELKAYERGEWRLEGPSA
jgi:predicted nucleotidyltransferase